MTLNEAKAIISRNNVSQAIWVLQEYGWLKEENVDDENALASALMDYLNNRFDHILVELGLWVKEVKVEV